MDVYVQGNTTPIVNDLAYGTASPFVELPAGSKRLEIRPFDAAATDPALFVTDPVELVANQSQDAIAAGLVGSTDPASAFRVLTVTERFAAAGENEAVIRVVHAGPDAPTVGVDLNNDDPAAPEIPNLERFTSSDEAGVAVPAGQALQVGIDADGARVTSFTTPELPAGASALIIATGLLSKLPRESDGFVLMAVTADGALPLIRQNPRVYALHASPDAPAVDISAGQTQLVSGLSFGTLSPSFQVAPGVYTLDVTPQGATDKAPVLSAKTPSLDAGQEYLAIVTGFAAPPQGAPALQLIALREQFDIDPLMARLRAVHAAPGVPPVDVGVVEKGTFTAVRGFSGLSFGNATAEQGVPLRPGPATVAIATSGTTDALATFQLDVTAGARAFAVAVGTVNATPPVQPVALVLVQTQTAPWTATLVQPTATVP